MKLRIKQLIITWHSWFILAIILIIVHLSAMLFYINDNRSLHKTALRSAMIQKIVNVINLIYATPVENRQHAITALADPYLTATISKQPQWLSRFQEISFWRINQALHHQLSHFAISIKLEKQQWLNINATIVSHFVMRQLILVVSEFVVFSLILVTFWLTQRYSKPLRDFKRMAEKLGLDLQSQPLLIDGPSVVKEAAAAMNVMRQRIQDLIRHRTQMLAAISHDLRTPLTRLKLRVQFVEDHAMQQQINHDLSEMETMLNETLVFARDDYQQSPTMCLDLVSLLSAICNDLIDLGEPVTFCCDQQHIKYHGKLIALKRAFNNIISNALRYGQQVAVCVKLSKYQVTIMIKDNGPGIPNHELTKVFEPFYRSENSRCRHTGGTGLGLAVARDIITSHGGKINLKNHDQGGLLVTVILPCPLNGRFKV